MITKNVPFKTPNSQLKNKKPFIFFVAILFISHLSTSNLQLLPTANADTVSDPNYSIDVGTIDTNPQPTPHTQILGTHTMQQKEFTTGSNYTVSASKDAFTFGLSQNLIDYGILSSTNPIIRTSDITFSSPQHGAELLTYENHPLLSTTNDLIQNTTCDNGACSAQVAALWNNTLTYGFGYRCESNDPSICDKQFSTSNYFKQYPDFSKNQLPTVVLMTKSGVSTTKAQVTYKVNISGTQKTGGYYNSITYLAVPNF